MSDVVEIDDAGLSAVGKLQNAWRRAMVGPHSEIILNDLKFYANNQAHVPGDPYTTAFNDGMRTIANNIILMIEGELDVQTKTNVKK